MSHGDEWRGARHQSAKELRLSEENERSVVNYTTPIKVIFQQPTNNFLWKTSSFPDEFTILQNNQRPKV